MPKPSTSQRGNVFYCLSASAATAAAKSLQSCPTLCNPVDSSLPGSAVPGILQEPTGVGCHFLLQCMKVKSESEVAQSCPTLSNPMDCSPPGSSVYGILQARVLEWGAMASSEYTAKRSLNTKANKDFFGHVKAERIYTISSSGRRKMIPGVSIDTYKGKKSTRYPSINKSFSYF